MSLTPNYEFHLVDSDAEKAKTTRENLNGASGNSDIRKIDTILAQKADEIEYNDEEGTLQLKSLGQPLGDPVPGAASRWGSFQDLIPDESDSETQTEP